MTPRIGSVGLAAIGGLALSLHLSAAPQVPPSDSAQAAARAATPRGLVISEVLFDPLPGARPFVELLNAGTTPVSLSRTALRVGEKLVLLARVPAPLAAGSRLLVRFDGATTTEPGVHHARTDIRFEVEAGTVALLDETNEAVDQVSWGAVPGAVSYGAAGVASDSIAPGSTIGRPPGANRASHPLDWVVYPAAQATPAEANPLPAVAEMQLSSGVIVTEPSANLAWYGVPGAADYRVQVATDAAFATIRVDQVTATPSYRVGPLASGQYYWRVQARAAGGPAAAYSKPSIMIVRTGTSARAAMHPGVLLRPLSSQTQTLSSLPLPTVMLPVPHVLQHKDTKLLQLENPVTGGAHAWNVNHGAFDSADPADAGNCLLASTAMINRYHKGNLSQDRLAYEALGPKAITYLGQLRSAGHSITTSMLTEPEAGPEWDFVYGPALSVRRALVALTFALGVPPCCERTFGGNAQFMWTMITNELDNGRPVLLFTGHAVVVRGFGFADGHRILYVNNPSHGLEAIDVTADPWPAHASAIFMGFGGVTARMQEASVTTDSDGDGVMDFDEIERFRTDRTEADTDDDGVDDFEDIWSGVFEIQHRYGYAFSPSTPSKGRDFDGDTLPTERDPDSDNGGCRDGLEDADGNGKREGSETSNFDAGDDKCDELQGSISFTVVTEHTVDGMSTYDRVSGHVVVKLRAPRQDNPDTFEDDGSSYSYRRTQHIVAAGPGCTITARTWANGSGSFTIDGASIGATIGDVPARGGVRNLREVAIGAQGPGHGEAESESCIDSGMMPIEDEFQLPECPGKQDLTPRTFVFNCSRPIDPTPIAGVRIVTYSVTGWLRLLESSRGLSASGRPGRRGTRAASPGN